MGDRCAYHEEMGNSYKGQFQDAQRLVGQKDKQITELQSNISSLQEKLAKEEASHAETFNEKVNEVAELKEKLASVESDLSLTKSELRKMELNRFAQEFANEEDRYRGEQTRWFKYTAWAAGGLIAVAVLTILNPENIFPRNGSYPSPENIFLNIILLTIFIYCLKQHSHLADLREDYANRKALAQSYQYMVEDEAEDIPQGHADIKEEFFAKAVEVFTKKPRGRGSDVTLYETMFAKVLGKK